MVLAVASAYGQIRASLDEGFDKPLNTSVVDLGASPYYTSSQHVRKKLTCSYYSSFTVKEYDEGEKGAERLSIVFSPKPACTLTPGADEKLMEGWSGYFWGAKENYAFFIASDGDDGGMPFVVFDARNGRKVFEDSVLFRYYIEKLNITTVFHVNTDVDQAVKLDYYRGVRPGCNLNGQETDCWKLARASFGITQTDIPACIGYEQADWESAVVYPVSVRFTDSPRIKSVDGPVFCWPTS